MSGVTTHYSAREAAASLTLGLDRIRELEKQRNGYSYSIPDRLAKEMEDTAEQIRDALAYFNERGEDE